MPRSWNGKKQCPWCQQMYTSASLLAADPHNDTDWRELAREHADDCEWIRTKGYCH